MVPDAITSAESDPPMTTVCAADLVPVITTDAVVVSTLIGPVLVAPPTSIVLVTSAAGVVNARLTFAVSLQASTKSIDQGSVVLAASKYVPV